jgi:uncharacterized protein
MTERMEIIDAHAHCGIQDRFPPQAVEDYRAAARGTGISTVVAFAPVMEIYDRHDPGFTDTPEWQERRRRANTYLLAATTADLAVIPYFFIWNDFAVDQLTPDHKGIKWHRHADEPPYHYDDPRCAAAIDEIRRRNLPVVLEEELSHTLRFIHEIAPGVRTIIPHLGMLNGGYRALADRDVFSAAHIYTDTALAPASEIRDYLDRYGDDRILFGSDFPFGHPAAELDKINRLGLPDSVTKKLVGGNLRRMLAENRV